MQSRKSPVFDPVDIPQLALESMNRVHVEEVELINQLATLLQQAKDQSVDIGAISEKLNEWVQHTREHFASEERLMVDYAFPASSIHASEHGRVMSIIQALKQKWQENHDAKPLYDFVFVNWPRWFNDHVNSMDRVTAEFIRQQMR